MSSVFLASSSTVSRLRVTAAVSGALEMCVERVGDRVLIVRQLRPEQSHSHEGIKFGFI